MEARAVSEQTDICLTSGFLLRIILNIEIIYNNCLNFALQYEIKRVQVNRDGWKLYGTYRLLVYADNIVILEQRVHNIKRNTEALVITTKKIGIDGEMVKI